MWAGGQSMGAWRHEDAAWSLEVESRRGLRRRGLQDAWRVGLDAATPVGPGDVFAVFDGVGGLPNGAAASQACAEALPLALEQERSLADVVRALSATANAAGGATTMTLAIVERGRLHAVQVGDSALFEVDAAGARRVTANQGVGNLLEQALGIGAPRPQILDRAWSGTTLVLCSDGVHGFTPQIGPQRASLLADVLEAVDDAGRPDDATLVVATPKRH